MIQKDVDSWKVRGGHRYVRVPEVRYKQPLRISPLFCLVVILLCLWGIWKVVTE